MLRTSFESWKLKCLLTGAMKKEVMKVVIEDLVRGKEAAEGVLEEAAVKGEAARMSREPRRGFGGRGIHES